MADDVLSAEQVVEIKKQFPYRYTADDPYDLVALCRSHEALRAQLTAEQYSRMAAESDLVDTRQQVEALLGRIERAETERQHFRLGPLPDTDRAERAEAALGRALAFLYDLQGFGHDPTCLNCDAEVLTKGEPHEGWCYLAKLLADPTGAAALARLRRLENLERVVREVRPGLAWIDGLTTDLERIDEALAALDEGEDERD